MTVPKFERPPVIDGRLDDEVWRHAIVLRDFYQISPGDNIAPSKQTEVFIGYDTRFLYFAFHAYDDPTKVRATLAKRDNVFGEDNVRIFLDTFNDQRKAYVLGFNPFGIQQDGILSESGGTDYSVDVVMESKGVLTDDGYTVEVAIPFKSLRYESGRGRLWGLHVWRNIDRFNDEMDSWMPLSRDRVGTLNQEGHLTGLEGISTERTLEVIPSLTLSETGRRVRSIPQSVLQSTPGLIDPGRFVNDPIQLEPGLNVKYGITPTVTLDLTLNPDFAQVEADQLVVTTNQRFPIFYPERRPFFLEGIDIFQTPLTAVHTRAIVDPDAAVKLTGKRGRNTFGLLLASDNGPGNLNADDRGALRQCQERRVIDPRVICSAETIVDHNASIGVLRVKHDVGRENSVGLVATSYNFIQKHNQLGGVDGHFRPNKVTTVDFQLLGTTSRRLFFDPVIGGNIYRTGNGFAYEALYDVTKRNWGWQLYAEGRTRDYRAEVGFTPRTNTNYNAFAFRYSTDPQPKKRLIGWQITSYTHLDYDWRARFQIWETDVVSTWFMQRSTSFYVAYRRGYERIYEEEFGFVRTATRTTGRFFGEATRSTPKNHYVAFFSMVPSRQFSFSVKTAMRTGTFDFDFGGAPKFPRVSPAALANPNTLQLDPGAGNLLDITGSAAYKPSAALNFTLNFTKNRLVRVDTHRVAFDDNIVSLRGTYQFTRFLAARARVDYTSLQQRARAQFLMAWTPSPGTAFYLGYNDDVNYNFFSPINGLHESGINRNGRTFFIKMSYLFRKSFGG